MALNFTVSQNGVPLDPSLYTWDDETRTFTSAEDNLMLDFYNHDKCTFHTGGLCIFTAGSFCNFYTSSRCNFDTGQDCNFYTGDDCTFDTGSFCTFTSGVKCIAIIRYCFWVVDLSDYKKVEFLKDQTINLDGEIMKYKEYQYLELVKNI
jgi:hypothetical protein